MKRFFVFMMSLCMVCLTNISISAETDEELWLSYSKKADTLTVEIKTAGNVADGLSEITYPDFITFIEAKKANAVDMSAVNANTKGSIKVDYLAKDVMEAGNVYVFTFQIDKDHAQDEITLNFKSEAHDKDGNDIAFQNGSITIPKEETKDPVVPELKPEEDQDEQETANKDSESADTGDYTNIAFLIGSMTIAAGALCISSSRKKHR